jgi:hypothetical protein
MRDFDTPESDYGLINMKTGEITPMDVVEDKPGRWDRVYGKALAMMLNESGEQRTRVIACLVAKRDKLNFIHCTISEIAKSARVSTKTVNRTLLELEAKNFIHRIRNGKLMFSPNIIRTGENSAGLMVVSMWKKETENED